MFQVGDRVVLDSDAFMDLKRGTIGTVEAKQPATRLGSGKDLVAVQFDGVFGRHWCYEDELKPHWFAPSAATTAPQPHTPPPTPQPLYTPPKPAAYNVVTSNSLTLPQGYKVEFNSLELDTHSSYTYVSEEQRKKRKEEGRCEECGELLPISIWGLGECPKHPKNEPVKQ